MTFAIAKKKNEFWNAYYENKDERFIYKEPELTPEEFFEVWIDKDLIHEYKDEPKRSEK